MKNLLIILLLFGSSSTHIFSQTKPASDELRTRVPELPSTTPIEIIHAPVPIWEPAPPPPPIIQGPEADPIHHDSIRNVYWIHGFGGNRDRWSDARDASQNPAQNKEGFKARQLDSYAPSYEENGSLDLASNDVAQAVVAGTIHQSEDVIPSNFLIGHSQGGVVSRYLVTKDYCSSSPSTAKDFYGGLVTFNSSLNGAEILNSRNNGKINNTTLHICEVIQELLDSGVAGNLIAKFIIKDEEGNEEDGGNFCKAFSEDVVPFLFKGLSQPISNDYQVGSPIIDQVNACAAPEIAKVAFFGVEPYEKIPGAQFENPIFYRTVQHFQTDVNWSPIWGANDDNEMAIKWSKKADERYAKYEQKKSLSNVFHWISTSNPFGHWIGSEIREKAEAHLGVYYLYHDINDMWMNIIGAKTIADVPYVVTTHNCSCNISQGTYITTVNVPNAQSELSCTHPNAVNCTYSSYPMTTYIAEWVEKPSDGVVLQESAQHMAGATFPPQEMRVRFSDSGVSNEVNTGSSHMQARNDRNTRDALRALYNGDLGIFFRTDVKQ